MNIPLTRRHLLSAALALPLVSFAEDYPARPIKIIVPVPPGGAADTLARIVGEKLTTKWGQPVIVENRVGAAGNIGAEYVYVSPPDGYTLLLAPPGPIVINKLLYRKLAFDSDEFVPVSIVAANPNVLLVHPKVPAKTVPELIAYAKAHPGKLNYGSSGSGSTTHLAGELFKRSAGVDIAHIPYKGGPQAYSDLLSGQVDMMFQGLVTALPQIREGKLRVLAVCSDKRHAALPDVPTLNQWLPGFVSVSWSGMVAPPRTPPALAERISVAVAEGMRQLDAGNQNKGIDFRDLITSSPVEARKFIHDENERWGAVIKATNITID